MVNPERPQLNSELTESLKYQSRDFCQEMAKRGILPQEILLPNEIPASIGSFTTCTPEILDQSEVILSSIFIFETKGNKSTGIIIDCFGIDNIVDKNLSPDRKIITRSLKNGISLVTELYKMKPLEGENYWAGMYYFSDNPQKNSSCCFSSGALF